MSQLLGNTGANFAAQPLGALAFLAQANQSGPLTALIARQQALQNPAVRASLVGSPFAAGLFNVTGGTPLTAEGPLPPSGVGPGAPQQLFNPRLPAVDPVTAASMAQAGMNTDILRARQFAANQLLGAAQGENTAEQAFARLQLGAPSLGNVMTVGEAVRNTLGLGGTPLDFSLSPTGLTLGTQQPDAGGNFMQALMALYFPQLASLMGRSLNAQGAIPTVASPPAAPPTAGAGIPQPAGAGETFRNTLLTPLPSAAAGLPSLAGRPAAPSVAPQPSAAQPQAPQPSAMAPPPGTVWLDTLDPNAPIPPSFEEPVATDRPTGAPAEAVIEQLLTPPAPGATAFPSGAPSPTGPLPRLLPAPTPFARGQSPSAPALPSPSAVQPSRPPPGAPGLTTLTPSGPSFNFQDPMTNVSQPTLPFDDRMLAVAMGLNLNDQNDVRRFVQTKRQIALDDAAVRESMKSAPAEIQGAFASLKFIQVNIEALKRKYANPQDPKARQRLEQLIGPFDVGSKMARSALTSATGLPFMQPGARTRFADFKYHNDALGLFAFSIGGQQLTTQEKSTINALKPDMFSTDSEAYLRSLTGLEDAITTMIATRIALMQQGIHPNTAAWLQGVETFTNQLTEPTTPPAVPGPIGGGGFTLTPAQ